MPTGIIFTTNSFYKIEIENLSCKSKLFYFILFVFIVSVNNYLHFRVFH